MAILVFLLMLLQLIFLDPLSFHVFVPIATPSAYLSVLQPFQFYSKVGLLCLDPLVVTATGGSYSNLPLDALCEG